MKLPLNQKYLDNLLNYRESALEHAGNDRTLYLNHMLNYREFCAQSKEAQSLGEDMERALKKAVADQDHASVQRLLFTFYQGVLTAYWRSGCDHSRLIFQIIPFLSCASYDNIFRAFPKELPLSEYGHTMCINGANLVQCILYPGMYDTEKVIEKAETHINSKQPKWDRAFVACLFGVLKNDAELFSQNIQLLCELHSRNDISKFLKIRCVFAYGMWVFAKHNMVSDVFAKVKMPVYKNFDKEYLTYISENAFSTEPVYVHPEPFTEFNYLFEIPIPITRLYQPYFNNENYTKREQKVRYLDTENMNMQCVEEIMKRIGES